MSISSWLAGWRGLNRQEIAEDLGVSRRAPGLWGARVSQAFRAGALRAREFVAQAPEKAFQAGQKIASRVITMQRSVRLPEHLVERSARSVLDPRKGPEPTGDWLEGYRQVAEERVPALTFAAGPADPEPESWADEYDWSDGPDGLEPADKRPDGPSWPDNPSRDDPDREAG